MPERSMRNDANLRISREENLDSDLVEAVNSMDTEVVNNFDGKLSHESLKFPIRLRKPSLLPLRAI